MCKQRWGNREMLSITAQLYLTGLGKVFDRQTSVNIFIIKMCRRTGVKLTKLPCFMKTETPVDSDCNPEPIPTVSEAPWWVWVEITTFPPPLRKSDFSRVLFRVGFLSHCWKFHTHSPLLSSCTLSTDAGLEEDVLGCGCDCESADGDQREVGVGGICLLPEGRCQGCLPTAKLQCLLEFQLLAPVLRTPCHLQSLEKDQGRCDMEQKSSIVILSNWFFKVLRRDDGVAFWVKKKTYSFLYLQFTLGVIQGTKYPVCEVTMQNVLYLFTGRSNLTPPAIESKTGNRHRSSNRYRD